MNQRAGNAKFPLLMTHENYPVLPLSLPFPYARKLGTRARDTNLIAYLRIFRAISGDLIPLEYFTVKSNGASRASRRGGSERNLLYAKGWRRDANGERESEGGGVVGGSGGEAGRRARTMLLLIRVLILWVAALPRRERTFLFSSPLRDSSHYPFRTRARLKETRFG